jgi:hypothetical protein
MRTIYKLNGSFVEEKDIPKDAKKVDESHIIRYETKEYSKEQSKNAMDYFGKMQEDREELNRRHG